MSSTQLFALLKMSVFGFLIPSGVGTLCRTGNSDLPYLTSTYRQPVEVASSSGFQKEIPFERFGQLRLDFKNLKVYLDDASVKKLVVYPYYISKEEKVRLFVEPMSAEGKPMDRVTQVPDDGVGVDPRKGGIDTSHKLSVRMDDLKVFFSDRKPTEIVFTPVRLRNELDRQMISFVITGDDDQTTGLLLNPSPPAKRLKVDSQSKKRLRKSA